MQLLFSIVLHLVESLSPLNKLIVGRYISFFFIFLGMEKLYEELFAELISKRGELIGKEKAALSKKIDAKKFAKEYFEDKFKLRDFEEKGIKPFFRLHPPVGGFERKGIKVPFAQGGVLGYRKGKINDLIKKMI